MHLDKIQIRVWIRSGQNSKDERTRVSEVRPSPCPRFSEMPVSGVMTLSVSEALKNLVSVSESTSEIMSEPMSMSVSSFRLTFRHEFLKLDQ